MDYRGGRGGGYAGGQPRGGTGGGRGRQNLDGSFNTSQTQPIHDTSQQQEEPLNLNTPLVVGRVPFSGRGRGGGGGPFQTSGYGQQYGQPPNGGGTQMDQPAGRGDTTSFGQSAGRGGATPFGQSAGRGGATLFGQSAGRGERYGFSLPRPQTQATAGGVEQEVDYFPVQAPVKQYQAPVQPQAYPVQAPVQPQAYPVQAPVQPQAYPVQAPVQPQAYPVQAPVQSQVERPLVNQLVPQVQAQEPQALSAVPVIAETNVVPGQFQREFSELLHAVANAFIEFANKINPIGDGVNGKDKH